MLDARAAVTLSGSVAEYVDDRPDVGALTATSRQVVTQSRRQERVDGVHDAVVGDQVARLDRHPVDRGLTVAAPHRQPVTVDRLLVVW